MHYFKRILSLILAAVLAAALCGCDPQASVPSGALGQEDFDAWLQSLLPEMVDSDTFSAGFLFLDPAQAGLPEAGSGFGWVSEEDWQQSGEDTEQMLSELKAFDPAQLDADSQRTLALLKDSLVRQEELADFYLLAANDIGMESEAAQLATSIAHAPYQSKEDLDRLFALYEDLNDSFHRLVELEQTRQQAGMGMTRAEIDLAIEEFEKLLAGDPPAAQLLGDEVIDSCSFLSEAEKQEYHEKNAQAISELLVPAYEYLIESLDAMPGRDGLPGLAGREGGREYYAALIRNLGFDETPEELMDYIVEQFDIVMEEIQDLIAQADDLETLEAVLTDPESFAWTEDSSPIAVLEYLEDASKSEFPPLEIGEVTADLTAEALRSNAVIAYYVLSPLDEPAGADKEVYINDEHSGTDYFTMAHEGFPGHLYQDTYAASQDRSYVRRLLERLYVGASEGWGVYSELTAAAWTQADPIAARIAALSGLADYLVSAWADIGINYLGWTDAELTQQLEDTFGVDLGDADEFFALLAAMPGTWVSYGAGGAKFLELRRRAEDALGADFDPVSYHRAVLDAAPASFPVIEDAVNAYIDSAMAAPAAEQAA